MILRTFVTALTLFVAALPASPAPGGEPRALWGNNRQAELRVILGMLRFRGTVLWTIPLTQHDRVETVWLGLRQKASSPF